MCLTCFADRAPEGAEVDADKVLSNLLISWLSRSLSLRTVLRLRSMAMAQCTT